MRIVPLSVLLLTLSPIAIAAPLPQSPAAASPLVSPDEPDTCTLVAHSKLRLNLSPGDCNCWIPRAESTSSGECVYHAQPNQNYLERLQRYANFIYPNSVITLLAKKSDANPRSPTADLDTFTISFWMDDLQANQEFAASLRSFNGNSGLVTNRTLMVEASVYRFEQSKERDLAYEMGFFFGKQAPSPTGTTTHASASIADLVLSGLTTIGNPLASFLHLGFNKMNKDHLLNAEHSVSRAWNVGRTNSINNQTALYIEHPGLSTTTVPLGFSLSADLQVSNSDPTLVQLTNLGFTYASPASPTAVANQSVGAHREDPFPSQDGIISLHLGETYVVYKSIDELSDSVKGTGSHNQSTSKMETIFLLRVYDDRTTARPDPLSVFENNVSYTPFTAEQTQALAKTVAASELFKSLQLDCKPSPSSLLGNEQICGLEFSKMDQTHLHKPLVLKVTQGELKHPDSEGARNAKMTFEMAAKGHGFYEFPMPADGAKSNHYAVQICQESISNGTETPDDVQGVLIDYHYDASIDQPFRIDNQKILTHCK